MALDFCTQLLDETCFVDNESLSLLFSPGLLSDYEDVFGLDTVLPSPPLAGDFDWDISDIASLVQLLPSGNEHVTEEKQPECTCRCPIVRDCMWSANLSVRIPGAVDGCCTEGQYSNSTSTSCSRAYKTDLLQLNGCSHCVDVDKLTDFVDTKSVFNYILAAPAPQTRVPLPSGVPFQCKTELASETICEDLNTTFHSITSTPMKREPTSDYDDSFGSNSSSDDDFDIDVECLSDSASDESIPSKIARVLVLPAATSMSAQVAAMHNYSSTQCPPPGSSAALLYRSHSSSTTSSSSSRSSLHHYRNAASATQSSTFSAAFMRSIKYRGTTSNPSSPSSSYRRRVAADRSSGVRGKKRRHFQREMSSTSADDSESDLNKRAMHNVLERKRRNNLKEYFSALRDEVPSLRVEQRSSKVVILRRTREFIYEMKSNERASQIELARQQTRRAELLARLEMLSALN